MNKPIPFNPNKFSPDPKPEKVIKEKKIYKYKRKPTGEKPLFESIWAERPHNSQISNIPIPNPDPANFLHILPKALNKYPKFKLNKQNIIIGTKLEHHLFDNDRSKIINDPQWQWVFELEASLKQQYNDLYS